MEVQFEQDRGASRSHRDLLRVTGQRGAFMPIPPNVDEQKLAEAALAILGLSAFESHHMTRAWKGLDWDLTDLLYRKGWIEDPVGKSKSVVFTDQGARLAPALLKRHFGASDAYRGSAV